MIKLVFEVQDWDAVGLIAGFDRDVGGASLNKEIKRWIYRRIA